MADDRVHINNTLIWVGSCFTRDSRFLDGQQKLVMTCCFLLPTSQACQRLRKHAVVKVSLCVCLETGQDLHALPKLSDIHSLLRRCCVLLDYSLYVSASSHSIIAGEDLLEQQDVSKPHLLNPTMIISDGK